MTEESSQRTGQDVPDSAIGTVLFTIPISVVTAFMLWMVLGVLSGKPTMDEVVTVASQYQLPDLLPIGILLSAAAVASIPFESQLSPNTKLQLHQIAKGVLAFGFYAPQILWVHEYSPFAPLELLFVLTAGGALWSYGCVVWGEKTARRFDVNV